MRRSLRYNKCTEMSENGKIGKSYFGILLIVMLVFPTHAFACHHYARWYYPYPQPRCSFAARTTSPNDHNWYVEITAVPIEDDSDLREVGIEKLRQQLK